MIHYREAIRLAPNQLEPYEGMLRDIDKNIILCLILSLLKLYNNRESGGQARVPCKIDRHNFFY